MPEEEKLRPSEEQVDLDTSGPEVDVTLEDTKEEAVVDTCLLYTSPSPRD